MDRKDVIFRYFPKFVTKSEPNNSMFLALGDVSQELFNDAENSFEQVFVNKATWGLEQWEEFLAIYSEPGKDDSYRRSVILSKLQGFGVVTPQFIKDMSLAYKNGEIEVIQDVRNYLVTIKFVSLVGIPPNINDFFATMEEIKPAHLIFNYSYRYATWGEVKPINWDQAKTYTWEGIKNGDFII